MGAILDNNMVTCTRSSTTDSSDTVKSPNSNKGEGGGSRGRGSVPERTGKRSRCCGFVEVLGFIRAELQVMNIGFRDFKMTAWSFQTSLTKWDPLTRPGW